MFFNKIKLKLTVRIAGGTQRAKACDFLP